MNHALNHKVCIGCKKRKYITEFAWSNKANNLHKPRCRGCDAAYRKRYYENNREKIKARNQRAIIKRRNKVAKGEILEPQKKLCIDCGKTQSVNNFRWADKAVCRRISRCRVCDQVHRAKVYIGRKELFLKSNKRTQAKLQRLAEYHKNKPCTDCRKLYPSCVMDFDHVRGEKVAKVSRLVQMGSEKLLLDEIAKCEVVCANCHRMRTHNRSKQRRKT
jgi:hypothetical protein